MNSHWYGRPQTNEAGHNRQSRNAPVPPREDANALYPESRHGYVPPREAYAGHDGLQNAQIALDNVRTALENARVPYNQPHPNKLVAFSREGLQSVDIAMNNVQMALANIRALPQVQRHVGVDVESEDRVEFNDEVPRFPRPVYTYPTTATGPIGPQQPGPSTSRHPVSRHTAPRHATPNLSVPSSPFRASTPTVSGSHAVAGTVSSQRHPEVTSTTSTLGFKRRASQAFDGDDTSDGQGSKYLKTDTKKMVVPNKRGPPLPGTVATQVDVDGMTVPLVSIPHSPQGHKPTNHGNGQLIIRTATRCLSQLPGFRFPQYTSKGMQKMASFINALRNAKLPSEKKCYTLLYRLIPCIFREMLSQRAYYAGVIDHAAKRSFFSHVHQVHYSVLVHQRDRIRNPRQRAKPNVKAEIWAKLEIDVLIDVIEAVVAAREAFLQDLANKRNFTATAQSKIRQNGQQDTDSGCLMKNMDPTGAETKASIKIKSEPGFTTSDMDDLDYKSEPEERNSIRLRDIPEFKSEGNGNDWLDDLDSEDEDNVPRPPSVGRQYREARKVTRKKLGELRTRNAVDRWIRFIRADPSC